MKRSAADMSRGGTGSDSGAADVIDDWLDESESNDPGLLGSALFEEEGEAKVTKAFKKIEENRNKKPWEQVLFLFHL